MAGFYTYYRDHDRAVDPATKAQILKDLFEHSAADGFPRHYLNDLCSPTITIDEFKTRLFQEHTRMWKLLSGASRRLFACKLSEHISRREKRMQLGKLTAPLNSLLNRTPKDPFQAINQPDGNPYPSARAQHRSYTDHFCKHFDRNSEWVQANGLNDDTPEGQLKRDSLLHGTWRNTYLADFLSYFPEQDRDLAGRFLDNFKKKAEVSPEVEAQLLASLSSDFSLQDFLDQLHSAKAHTAPGPSGLTISILQHTPIPILNTIFTITNTLWQHRTVAASWQKRLLVALKKKPSSSTLSDLRPIMLLEVIRKLFPLKVALNQ
jgi:hypothetical protein